MPLPRPELGLVVRYGFTWKSPDRRLPPDAGKDRPCLIIDLREAEGATRVIYLPISHTAPRDSEQAFEFGDALRRHLGLDGQTSYLYTSYACEDDWPYDLAKRPGTDDFDYGFIPPRLFARVADEFARRLAMAPGFPNQR
jgi:hypothetical protein